MINSSNTSQLTEIDAIALKQKLDLQRVILVDVRESGEYATEHILGSISRPLSTFDTCAMGMLLMKLPYNQKTL